MQRMTTRTLIGGGLATLGVVALLLASRGVADADPPDRKLQREARIFERVLDDMLIDSPNWLVPGRKNARGYYVPGHGIIFTFQTSLVDRSWGRHLVFNWGWGEDDGPRLRRDRDRDDDDEDRNEERAGSRTGDREMRLYERGKQEITDVLFDFGDIFESLNPSEVVTVVAHLDGADLFWDEDIRRLEMTVRVSDLRAAATGGISEDELEKRIEVAEY